MITAGIDVGLKNTKIAIMDEGIVIATGIGLSGGIQRTASVQHLWEEVLGNAGLKFSDIDKTIATGQGKLDVPFADDIVVEAVADANAATYFLKKATSVIDIGADQTRIITLDGEGSIKEVVVNQKCMAGLGLLIETMADRLGMSIDEISNITTGSDDITMVNDGCPVFAEQGALELLNIGVAKEVVAAAVINVVVVRLNSILNDKTKPSHSATVLIGGVSRNAAVAKGLRIRSGIDLIIPQNAEYGGAIGAALLSTRSLIMS